MADIESLDNPLVKKVVKLSKNRKYREEHSLGVVYGEHLVEEALKYDVLEMVVFQEETLSKISFPKNVKCFSANKKIMDKINILDSICNIIGIVRQTKGSFNVELEDCILLENIQDPGNLGTILRSAKASGVNNVILAGNFVDPYNPKVLRGSQGAVFGLNLCYITDIMGFIENYKGNIIATAPHAKKSIYEIELTQPVMMVFGNEGAGISLELLKLISEQVAIPMANDTESLNVAMAATVCLFEQSRQRLYK